MLLGGGISTRTSSVWYTPRSLSLPFVSCTLCVLRIIYKFSVIVYARRLYDLLRPRTLRSQIFCPQVLCTARRLIQDRPPAHRRQDQRWQPKQRTKSGYMRPYTRHVFMRGLCITYFPKACDAAYGCRGRLTYGFATRHEIYHQRYGVRRCTSA